jgi:hypothetical protein
MSFCIVRVVIARARGFFCSEEEEEEEEEEERENAR